MGWRSGARPGAPARQAAVSRLFDDVVVGMGVKVLSTLSTTYLQDLASEQEAMHHFSFEKLTDVEDLMRVMHPDEDLQGGEQCLPHSALAHTQK